MIKILVDGVEFERGEEVEYFRESKKEWLKGKLQGLDLDGKEFFVLADGEEFDDEEWYKQIRKIQTPPPIPEFDRVVMHVANEKTNPRYVWRRVYEFQDPNYFMFLDIATADCADRYEQAYIPDGYTGTLDELEWVKIVDVVRGEG